MDIKSVQWDKLKEADAVVTFIKRRWERGQLVIVKLLGLSGMGKSYASIRLAELLAKEIHGDNYRIDKRNIIKNLLDLIRFIKSVEKPGEIMVIEEMSVLFPSRRAMSGINVDANAIVDTVRKKGIIILSNYPLNKTVDSHIEAMCCLQIVTLQLNKTLGICIAYPLRLQTNPAIPKTYFHKLLDKEGNEIDFIFFKSPSKDLISPYEQEKDKLMDSLYETLEKKELLRKERVEKELSKIKRSGGLGDLTKRQLEIYNMVYLQKKRVSDVAKELGISQPSVTQTMKVINNKLEKEEIND